MFQTGAVSVIENDPWLAGGLMTIVSKRRCRMKSRQKLARYASLLIDFGTASVEAEKFLRNNSADREFFELAKLAKGLKEALAGEPAESEVTMI